MFGKLKHRFDEKGKKAVALLATAALLCSFTGCAGNEASNAIPDSVTSALQSTPDAESKDSVSSQVNSDNTSSSDAQTEQNSGQSEFDFDEAVKNITLFGHKISLPCMWSDFGEDFSYGSNFIPADNDLGCPLLYNGKNVGMIFFGNCDAKYAHEIETKPVVCIVAGHYNYGYPYDSEELDWLDRAGYYSGLLELDFYKFTMKSTEDEILEVLGTPNDRSEGFNCHYLVYDYDSGYLLFTINDDAGRNGRLLEMHVCVEVN